MRRQKRLFLFVDYSVQLKAGCDVEPMRTDGSRKTSVQRFISLELELANTGLYLSRLARQNCELRRLLIQSDCEKVASFQIYNTQLQ